MKHNHSVLRTVLVELNGRPISFERLDVATLSSFLSSKSFPFSPSFGGVLFMTPSNGELFENYRKSKEAYHYGVVQI